MKKAKHAPDSCRNPAEYMLIPAANDATQAASDSPMHRTAKALSLDRLLRRCSSCFCTHLSKKESLDKPHSGHWVASIGSAWYPHPGQDWGIGVAHISHRETAQSFRDPQSEQSLLNSATPLDRSMPGTAPQNSQMAPSAVPH
jgi:hypothetical protein